VAILVVGETLDVRLLPPVVSALVVPVALADCDGRVL